MSTVLDFKVSYSRVCDCCVCGEPIVMSEAMSQAFHRNHRTYYCVKGHRQYWPQESDIEKECRLRKEAENSAERERTWRNVAEEDRDCAERSAAAYKGHLTRTRNRIGNGVCPCCNRAFKNLADHMQTKHPDYAS